MKAAKRAIRKQQKELFESIPIEYGNKIQPLKAWKNKTVLTSFRRLGLSTLPRWEFQCHGPWHHLRNILMLCNYQCHLTSDQNKLSPKYLMKHQDSTWGQYTSQSKVFDIFSGLVSQSSVMMPLFHYIPENTSAETWQKRKPHVGPLTFKINWTLVRINQNIQAELSVCHFDI